jgi:hypothetical protein
MLLEFQRRRARSWEAAMKHVQRLDAEISELGEILSAAYNQEKDNRLVALKTSKEAYKLAVRREGREAKDLAEDLSTAELEGANEIAIDRMGSQSLSLADAKERIMQLRATVLHAAKAVHDATVELVEFEPAFPEVGLHVMSGLPAELMTMWRTGWTLESFSDCELIASPDTAGCMSRNCVYKAVREDSTYAVKEYKIGARTDSSGAQRLRTFLREAQLLHRLRHPYVAELSGLFEDPNARSFYIMMPYYEHGRLDEWILNQRPDMTAIRRILTQVLLALEHLHSHGVLHTDVKPANILITFAGTARLADFNISVDTTTRATAQFTKATRIGYTQGFDAPELLQLGATVHTDMFAFGSTVQAVMGQMAQMGHVEEAACKELIGELHSPEPAHRPSAAAAMRHAFFEPLHKWQSEQQRTCCLFSMCDGTPMPIQSGVECSGASGELHFVCDDCFELLVLAAAKDDLRTRHRSDGRVMCPLCRDKKCPYSDIEIAKHVTSAAFEIYVKGRMELLEDRMAGEFEQRLKERIVQECAQLQQLDDKQRRVRLACRHIEEDILTCKCPRCGQAFVDFTGCFALSCSRCDCGFCAWCGADSGSNDAHPHVARCTSRPAHLKDPYFAPFSEFEKSKQRIRAQRLRRFLSTLDAETQASLRKEMHAHFKGLQL